MGLLHGVDLCSAGLQYAALHVVKLIVAPARPPTRQRVFVTQNAASDGIILPDAAFACPLLLENPPEGLLCENLNLLYNRSPSKGVSH